MNVFRRLSSRGLAVAIVAVAAVALAAVAAVAAFGGSGTTPPPQPLPQAIHDALAAPPVDGVTARIHFTNHLLPSGSLGSLAGISPLLSGASGRLWLTSDGRLRLELQSDAGDAQVVTDGKTLTVYDASSNTAYTLTLPAEPAAAATTDPATPSVSQIGTALSQLAEYATISGATPDSVAGQPAYTVRISPKSDAGLVGAAELSFDAVTGVPLRAAVYARGDSSPALELTATEIGFGPVPASDVDVTPPPGAKVVALSLPSTASTGSEKAPVTGFDAVSAAVPFALVAPESLGGLTRSDVRLTGSPGEEGALITYGEGLGTIVVSEHAAAAAKTSFPLAALPDVTINGAKGHELVTALGTAIQYESGGVSYTVAGSITQADAEAAAQALTS